MPRHTRVGDAFLWLHKTGKTAVLPQCSKAVTAAGQNFMDITLVAHIINDAVTRGIELPLKRNSQFDHAKVRGQMSPRARNRIDDKRAQRRTQHAQRVV